MSTTDSQFWRFALMLYGHKDLRETLLRFQEDYQVVILELLFAAWLAERGIAWSKAEHRRSRLHISAWVDEVVLPLRQLRQRWCVASGRDAGYRQLLSMELAAEQHLADLLLELMPNCDAQIPCSILLDDNLDRVFLEAGITDEAVAPLLSQLREAGLNIS